MKDLMHHTFLPMVMLYSKRNAMRQQRRVPFPALCMALPLAFMEQLVFTALG